MIPWLKNMREKGAGAMVSMGPDKSDLELKSEMGGDDGDKELEYITEDIFRAFESKSKTELMKALKSFFLCVDAQPHMEGPDMGEMGE